MQARGDITGPDVEEPVDDAAEPASMDHVVAGLWCQMLADMLIGKGPNPRSHLEASYATLDPMQQAAIDEVMYQRFTLPFSVVRYCVASMSHWTTISVLSASRNHLADCVSRIQKLPLLCLVH